MASDSEYPVTPGMTAVGVATLFITQEQLFKPEAKPSGDASPAAEAIDRGMRWIADHFDRVATDETYPRDYPYATLFAVGDCYGNG